MASDGFNISPPVGHVGAEEAVPQAEQETADTYQEGITAVATHDPHSSWLWIGTRGAWVHGTQIYYPLTVGQKHKPVTPDEVLLLQRRHTSCYGQVVVRTPMTALQLLCPLQSGW